jgi:hypothetical protein
VVRATRNVPIPGSACTDVAGIRRIKTTAGNVQVVSLTGTVTL